MTERWRAPVTKQQLFLYLSEDQLSEQLRDTLNAADLKEIVCGTNMSENHLGGDDLVAMVNDVLAAVQLGYTIVTWYGPDSETLVVGYRPDELQIGGDDDKKWIIKDWAGNHPFPNRKFDSFEDGLAFLMSQFPNEDDSQEFFVEKDTD